MRNTKDMKYKSEIDITATMKRAVEYYEYIDYVGEELSRECDVIIEPLLKANKFKEAKKAVMDFYKPSRSSKSGDVIFIEYDLQFAKINRHISAYNKTLT